LVLKRTVRFHWRHLSISIPPPPPFPRPSCSLGPTLACGSHHPLVRSRSLSPSPFFCRGSVRRLCGAGAPLCPGACALFFSPSGVVAVPFPSVGLGLSVSPLASGVRLSPRPPPCEFTARRCPRPCTRAIMGCAPCGRLLRAFPDSAFGPYGLAPPAFLPPCGPALGLLPLSLPSSMILAVLSLCSLACCLPARPSDVCLQSALIPVCCCPDYMIRTPSFSCFPLFSGLAAPPPSRFGIGLPLNFVLPLHGTVFNMILGASTPPALLRPGFPFSAHLLTLPSVCPLDLCPLNLLPPCLGWCSCRYRPCVPQCFHPHASAPPAPDITQARLPHAFPVFSHVALTSCDVHTWPSRGSPCDAHIDLCVVYPELWVHTASRLLPTPGHEIRPPALRCCPTVLSRALHTFTCFVPLHLS